MRKLLRLTSVLALVVLVLLPVELSAVERYFNYQNATLPASSTNVSFGFQAYSILVQNRNAAGGTAIYVDWAGGTATSADNELKADSSRSYTAKQGPTGSIIGMRDVSLMCASGTCSVQVLALK